MTVKKDTNPKDAVGTKKVPVSVLSHPVIMEMGLALLEGGRKYGRHNYRAVGVRASVYIDAAFRHLSAWWEGEDIDPDSGLSHITKAMAGLMVLRDSMLVDNWVDDRPPKHKEGWVQELNKKAEKIIEKHPDAVEPYTEKNTDTTKGGKLVVDNTEFLPEPDGNVESGVSLVPPFQEGDKVVITEQSDKIYSVVKLSYEWLNWCWYVTLDDNNTYDYRKLSKVK